MFRGFFQRALISNAWILGGFCVISALGSAPAGAYTPESPEVKQMINKGRGFIQSVETKDLGEACIAGLSLLKTGSDESDAKVAEAAKAAVAAAQKPEASFQQLSHENYHLAATIIFLCELDAQGYGSEIEKLLAHLEKRQMDHGGFGYRGDELGDTSQAQFVTLAIWSAKQAGFEVSQQMVERLCEWLLRTQDPSGAWGYHGKVSGALGQRIEQIDIRNTIVPAGLSCVYIMGYLFEAFPQSKRDDKSGLSSAFEPVAVKRERRGVFANSSIDKALIRQSCGAGEAWMNKHVRGYEAANRGSNSHWLAFLMYGTERYKSFKEEVLQQKEKEPAWYNEGVTFLKKHQQDNGQWKFHGQHDIADTVLSLLFLARSTQKSIERDWGAGQLTGDRGLPKDLAGARVKGGKIVGEALAGSVDDLLTVLENPDHADFESLVKNPENLLAQSSTKDAKAADRLQRLVAEGDYRARQVAVRALARSGNMDNVPHLIFALTDPDPRVVREARDGLRFLSRKFFGFGLSDDPTDEEKAAAIEKWKQWYRSIRPDAEFIAAPQSAGAGAD